MSYEISNEIEQESVREMESLIGKNLRRYFSVYINIYVCKRWFHFDIFILDLVLINWRSVWLRGWRDFTEENLLK